MTVKRYTDGDVMRYESEHWKTIPHYYVSAPDYDALAAELAEAKKRYSHEYSLVLEGICRKHEARVKELEALLRAAVCPNERNVGHEQAWQCQWCDERSSLTPAETEGDGPKCKRCNQYLCMCPIKPPIVSRNL